LNTSDLTTPSKSRSSKVYDWQVLQALITVWCTANQICSKRLVSFRPDLISVMEHHGHLRLPADVRKQLLGISAATIDRMLRSERVKRNLGVSTTRQGSLLKNQIHVRTFADWDGAKVSKKHDLAKTPYQRPLLSEHITQERKDALTSEYGATDPVKLLAQLESFQDALGHL